MADYFTVASFIIPCSGEQATTAINALKHINGEFSEYAEAAITKTNGCELSPEEKIICHCFFNHPDQNKDNTVKDLDWNFNVEPRNEGLWVFTDESIDTGQAAIFTQAVLLSFNLTSIVEIQAAHTCSKRRTDAFGGHACVVTKDHVRWNGLSHFLEAERKAHIESERYFMCDITELNGEYEYEIHFLMKCSVQDDPEQRLDEIFVNFRGDGEKERDGFVWNDCGTAAKNPNLKEITPYEFKVMERHLVVL